MSELETLIENVLRHNGNSVVVEGRDKSEVEKAKSVLRGKGYSVREEGGVLLFEASGERVLLKG